MRRILRHHSAPLAAGSFFTGNGRRGAGAVALYGMVALVGYSVSFDKTTFRLLRGESNLFYTLAKWENNQSPSKCRKT
jgi:two-component system sensor histidine kinase PhoQ